MLSSLVIPFLPLAFPSWLISLFLLFYSPLLRSLSLLHTLSLPPLPASPSLSTVIPFVVVARRRLLFHSNLLTLRHPFAVHAVLGH